MSDSLNLGTEALKPSLKKREKGIKASLGHNQIGKWHVGARMVVHDATDGALIEAAAAAARESGSQRIVLDSTAGNAPVVAFYEPNAFVANGVAGRMDPPPEHLTEHQRERWS